MPAIVAADSGKSFPEIATFDKSFGGNIDYRTPEAVSCRESLGIMILLKKKVSPNANAVYKAINNIAEMPIEGDNKVFSGRDHDTLLYGSSTK